VIVQHDSTGHVDTIAIDANKDQRGSSVGVAGVVDAQETAVILREEFEHVFLLESAAEYAVVYASDREADCRSVCVDEVLRLFPRNRMLAIFVRHVASFFV
jgi:hypothetical protein